MANTRASSWAHAMRDGVDRLSFEPSRGVYATIGQITPHPKRGRIATPGTRRSLPRGRLPPPGILHRPCTQGNRGSVPCP